MYVHVIKYINSHSVELGLYSQQSIIWESDDTLPKFRPFKSFVCLWNGCSWQNNS